MTPSSVTTYPAWPATIQQQSLVIRRHLVPRNIRRRVAEALAPRRDFASAPHRTRNPIIVLGFNKTGTTSLHHWFVASGIRSLHFGGYHAKNNIAMRIAENVKRNHVALHGLDHFEAFSDLNYMDRRQTLEGNRFFADLHASHPKAYFILNHRPVEDWIASRSTHSNGSLLSRAQHTLNLSADAVQGVWRDEYLVRLAEIRTYFTAHTARFLDVPMDDAAASRIATFLAPEYDLNSDQLRRRNQSAAARSALANTPQGETRNG